MRRCLILIAAVAAIVAQPRPGEWKGERVRRLQSAVEAERVRQGIAGMSVAVALESNIRWAEGFGKSDLENEIDARRHTVYRTASLAKPMTATAVLQLWERGKLDLDAPIQRYVPGFPEKPWRVTTRLLLGHLSGIRTYRGEERGNTRQYSSITEALGIFRLDPLMHPPGTAFLYTSFDYNLAGAAIEGASGLPYLDYLREYIFKPAKMEATRDDSYRDLIPHRTRFYTKAPDGHILHAPMLNTSDRIPGGGMASTAEDMARFAVAWESEKLLKAPAMRLQTQRQKLLNGSLTSHGLGWAIGPVAGRMAISHAGNQHGCTSLLAMFPEAKITIAVMSNSDFADLDKVAEVVLKALELESTLSGVQSGRGVIARPDKRP
jgi:CubicO group peptidase (beta-lactamase class C family)